MFGLVIRVFRWVNYLAGSRPTPQAGVPASITVYTPDGVYRLSRRVDA